MEFGQLLTGQPFKFKNRDFIKITPVLEYLGPNLIEERNCIALPGTTLLTLPPDLDVQAAPLSHSATQPLNHPVRSIA